MRAPAALWSLPPTAALLLSHLWAHHRQPSPYMDELYHVPQASLFCGHLPSLRRPPYLPELSTPPGAYLLPTLLSPLLGCSVRALRLHATLCALLTLPLLACVAHSLLGRRAPLLADARAWRTAAALATHPPLLFAGVLFYTDAPAAAAVAGAWALALRGRQASAAAAGLFATSVRQTSAVWHGALALHGICLNAVGVKPRRLRGMLPAVWPHLAAACVVLAALAWNGFSIAVGHREHHAVRPHWAMPAHFGAYTSLFGLPLLPLGLPSAGRLAGRRPLAAGCALAGATALLVAGVRATGGRVHRFVLADNRHYTFYLYRRLLAPLPGLRDAIAAAGAGALAVVCAPAADALADAGAGGKGASAAGVGGAIAMMGAIGATFVTVVPAELMEPRYFIQGYLVCMMLFLTNANVKFGNREAAVCVVFNLVVHFAVVYVFAEMPFSRPPDAHVPHDLSPGRFMY